MITPVLVGREQEFARLRAALDQALAGRGGSVLISGESGVGKTTLVQVLAVEARERGAAIYSGACYDFTATPPYGLWRDLVARAESVDGGDSSLSSLVDDAAWENATGVAALIRQVREAIESLASGRPAVVVLEDLHWADAPSLEMLREIVRRLGSMHALVLATYRDDEVGRDHPLYPLIPAIV